MSVRLYPRGLILVLLLATFWNGCLAAFSVELKLGQWEAPSFNAKGLQLMLKEQDGQSFWRLEINQLVLPDPIGIISDIAVDCHHARLHAAGLQCVTGTARFSHSRLSADGLLVSFVLGNAGQLELAFSDWVIAGGRLAGELHWEQDQWRISLTVRNLQTGDPLLAQLFPEYVSEARISGTLSLRGNTAGVEQGRWSLQLEDGQFSDAKGLQAGEGLIISFEGNFQRNRDEVLRWQARLDWRGGAVYVHPVFVEVAEEPISLVVQGRWAVDDHLWIDSFEFRDPSHLTATGKAVLRLGGEMPGLLFLQVDRLDSWLAGLYARYLQPFLIGTGLDQLVALGRVSGQLSLDAEGLKTVDLTLLDAFVDDRAGRFAVYEAEGQLRWGRDATLGPSRLSIGGGRLFGMDLGPASLGLEIMGTQLRLLERFRLPLLDGALRFNALAVNWGAPEVQSAELSITVEPISMSRLSTAMGWPLFDGVLAGDIPRLTLDDGRLRVDGRLVAQLFDGTMLLDEFQLTDPFGPRPVLTGDIRLQGLDLAAITRAFSLGRIEGRLDGYVRDLVLVGWQPAQFQASLYTPEGDRSRRRISQRAVDELTQIGGGVSGALSVGFLRLFEDFSYSQLGLSCRLEGTICYMDGVEPAPGGGYYIVKGAGLPRIDVVGYTREVAWLDLVNRLKVVSQSGRPSVQRP